MQNWWKSWRSGITRGLSRASSTPNFPPNRMLRTRCSEVLSRRAWPTPSSRIPGGLRILFDDLKDHGLPCPGGRSVEQVSHGSDGMAVSTYDSSDIGLSHFD